MALYTKLVDETFPAWKTAAEAVKEKEDEIAAAESSSTELRAKRLRLLQADTSADLTALTETMDKAKNEVETGANGVADEATALDTDMKAVTDDSDKLTGAA